MDNVTHTVVGILIAQSAASKKTVRGTAAIVIGANLPDLDVLWCTNHTDYLAFHRGITHTPIAILAMVLGAALALAVARRWWAAAPAPSTTRRWCLWFAVGLASHVVLDGLNSYGVRPFLPFSSRWMHGDLVFIIDPWIWGIGLAFLAMTARDRAARVLALAAAVVLAVTAWAVRNDRAPLWVPAGVATLLIAGVALRPVLRAVRPGTVAMSGLLALALYVAAAATLRSMVAARFMREYPQWTAAARDIALLPSPGDPSLWRIVVDDGKCYQ
ncbi:MAG: metal-dependent hydrolase, partial [Planctomycetota bacterium]